MNALTTLATSLINDSYQLLVNLDSPNAHRRYHALGATVNHNLAWLTQNYFEFLDCLITLGGYAYLDFLAVAWFLITPQDIYFTPVALLSHSWFSGDVSTILDDLMFSYWYTVTYLSLTIPEVLVTLRDTGRYLVSL